MQRALAICALAATVLLVAPLSALATSSAAPTIMFDIEGGDAATIVNESGTIADPNAEILTWTLDAPLQIEGVTIDSWTAQLKVDPFVTNNIVVTNNTAFTQTFIATVLLPIPAFAYDTVIFSSVGVTVTDSNGNGVMTFDQNGGTDIYQGLVDGSNVLPLNPPGLPIDLADCLPFVNPGCSATGSDGIASLGVTPGLATQIGITLTFDLSAGDSAGITSRFEIVPEPGTAMLFASGLFGLGIARRRQA